MGGCHIEEKHKAIHSSLAALLHLHLLLTDLTVHLQPSFIFASLSVILPFQLLLHDEVRGEEKGEMCNLWLITHTTRILRKNGTTSIAMAPIIVILSLAVKEVLKGRLS
jgi:hypothetical protein